MKKQYWFNLLGMVWGNDFVFSCKRMRLTHPKGSKRLPVTYKRMEYIVSRRMGFLGEKCTKTQIAHELGISLARVRVLERQALSLKMGSFGIRRVTDGIKD